MGSKTAFVNSAGLPVPVPRPVTIRSRGGVKHDDQSIQLHHIRAVFDEFDDLIWEYADVGGNQIHLRGKFHRAWKRACTKHSVPRTTAHRWVQHYLQYGETPADSHRRMQKRRMSKLRRYAARKTTFSANDSKILKGIVKANPQLYLDEIQLQMRQQCNHTWHPSTIWRQLQRLGYSLQACVRKARQQDETERENYRARLESFLDKPEMALYIDETHKSANASRRRRAWSKRGLRPTLVAEFEENFRQKYTMIAACDINGFVNEACKIVPRDLVVGNEANTGTVDTDKFVAYIAEYVVPIDPHCRL